MAYCPPAQRRNAPARLVRKPCTYDTVGFSCGCDRCEARMLSVSANAKARNNARMSVLMRAKPNAR